MVEATHPKELLPSFVLDALEEDERGNVETHLTGCASCRAEVAELTAAADALVTSITPVAPPPAARERLMARVAADRAHERALRESQMMAVTDPITGAPRVTEPFPRPQGQARRPRGLGGFGSLGGLSGPGGWASGIALAAVVLAGLTSWQTVTTQRELAAARQEMAQLRGALREQADALAELTAPGTRATPLEETQQTGGSATVSGQVGQMVYQPNGRSALFVLERLPALQPGRVYQLWFLRPGGAAPTSAGTFTLDAGGRASLVVRAPERLGTYSGIGLTAEPAPGRPAPTGPILASGSLTTG